MKFECGKKRRLKWEASFSWHRWFAWYPVNVAKEDCRWFEWVERRRTTVTYRYITDTYWEWRACRPVEKGSQ